MVLSYIPTLRVSLIFIRAVYHLVCHAEPAAVGIPPKIYAACLPPVLELHFLHVNSCYVRSEIPVDGYTIVCLVVKIRTPANVVQRRHFVLHAVLVLAHLRWVRHEETMHPVHLTELHYLIKTAPNIVSRGVEMF